MRMPPEWVRGTWNGVVMDVARAYLFVTFSCLNAASSMANRIGGFTSAP